MGSHALLKIIIYVYSVVYYQCLYKINLNLLTICYNCLSDGLMMTYCNAETCCHVTDSVDKQILAVFG
jgi:hypothetical protein